MTGEPSGLADARPDPNPPGLVVTRELRRGLLIRAVGPGESKRLEVGTTQLTAQEDLRCLHGESVAAPAAETVQVEPTGEVTRRDPACVLPVDHTLPVLRVVCPLSSRSVVQL